MKGNLANAFLIVTPLVLVGAVALLQGRRHVAGDIAAAAAPARRRAVGLRASRQASWRATGRCLMPPMKLLRRRSGGPSASMRG